MRYRRLGRTALKVSELALGCMNFGAHASEPESHAILDNAVANGINFIDTANQYGGDMGVGASETIIGNWLRQQPSRRDTLVLATKVHEPMSGDINDRGLSARHIQQACDASLRRLGVDTIDLYQFHHIDRTAPMDEIWQAADRLIAQGKITYVGSSNFPGWKIAQANEIARHSHRLGLVAEQSLYNLVERRIELEVLPACIDYGVGVIAWSPLAGGLLAGDGGIANRRLSPAVASARAKYAGQLAAFAALCQDVGEMPATVALAWILHQPGIAAAIIGPRAVHQLPTLCRAAEIQLDQGIIDRLDAIFPPLGPAPEAYAW